jgi:hypothetical protein
MDFNKFGMCAAAKFRQSSSRVQAEFCHSSCKVPAKFWQFLQSSSKVPTSSDKFRQSSDKFSYSSAKVQTKTQYA